MRLVEIFDDRERLGENLAIVDQGRHQPLRVEPQIIWRKLVVFPQMDEFLLIGESLEIERNSRSKCCRGAEIAVEFHIATRLPLPKNAPALLKVSAQGVCRQAFWRAANAPCA